MTRAPTVGTDAPPWLAEFLLQPPLWFKLGLVGVALVIFGLAARDLLRRDLYVAPEKLRDGALILATVEGVAVGVVGGLEVVGLGFLPAVAVGLFVGLPGVDLAARVGRRVLAPVTDGTGRLLVAWFLLAVGGMVLPQVALMNDVRVPSGFILATTIPAVCFLLLTLVQEFGPDETLGEALRQAE